MDLDARQVLERVEGLDERILDITLAHVQLDRKVVIPLKSCNILNLRDFLSAAEDSFTGNQGTTLDSWLVGFWNRFWTGKEVETVRRIHLFSVAAISGKVDWISFWESIDYDLSFAAAKLDEILELDDSTKEIDIRSLGMGKAGLLLIRNGIQNIGDLLPVLSIGLPDYSGFGKNKIWEFACGIRDFLGTINENRTHSSLVKLHTESTIKISYRGYLQYCSINGSKMSEATRKIPLSQFNLRKELKKLDRIGVRNIWHLFELFEKGLPEIKGVGQTARFNLYNAVKYADSAITENGDIDWKKFADLSGSTVYPGSEFTLTLDTNGCDKIDYRGNLQYCSINGSKMSEATRKLPLSQFNLRKELKKLDRIGVRNIWQLFELFEKGLPEIKGVGQTARLNLHNTVRYADLSITESGNIDWIRFAKFSVVKIIPEPYIPLKSGDQFLGCLDQVINDITAECLDKLEAEILLQRLKPDRENAFTLEQLGKNFNITRERVRQKQEALLDVLSSALLDNEYGCISFRFSEEFCSFWRVAARYLGSQPSLGYFEFIGGLAKVWGVTEAQVRPHLRIIYSILTNESTLPVEYSIGSIVPSAIFQIKEVQDLNRSILSLHPSRSIARSCERVGVKSLRDILNLLRLRSLPFTPTELDKISREILYPLAKAVNQLGTVKWEKYYEDKKIRLLPEIEQGNPVEFLNSAVSSILEFIRATPITARSEMIFINRVVPNAQNRVRLLDLGEKLGCFGSSIAKEQGDLLKRLYDAIFCGDYTDSKVHFRDAFIKMWQRSKTISQQTKAVPYFAELLSLEWDLPDDSAIRIAPMLLSVIKGRPVGYTGRNYSAENDSCNSAKSGNFKTPEKFHAVIRLRGFRSIH